jgi:hypothetical protein
LTRIINVPELTQGIETHEIIEGFDDEIDDSLIDMMLEHTSRLQASLVPVSSSLVADLLRNRTTEEYALSRAIDLERRHNFGDVDALHESIGSGHGKQVAALERLIRLKVIPTELSLARQIRESWSDHEEYHIYLQRGSRITITQATYRTLAWEISLALLRWFQGVPDLEDVEATLAVMFEHWRDDEALLEEFPAFQMWLKFLTATPMPFGLDVWVQTLERGWA